MSRITDILALHGKSQSKRIALKFPQDSSIPPVTYGDFVTHMNCIAENVNNLGLRNKRVATLLGNADPHTLSTMFGIAHGGACLVPLNASLKRGQIKTMLVDSQSKVVLVGKQYADLIPMEGLNSCRKIGFDFANNAFEPNYLNLSTKQSSVLPHSANDEFNIIYSSGTTSQPKGIVQSHANRMHWAWSNAIGMRYNADTRALTTTALYSNGTFLVTIPTLFCGGTLYVQNKFDAKQTLRTIAEERITHTFMVPTQLKMCLDVLEEESFDLSSLEMVLSAGSMLNASIKRRVLDKITPNLYELFGCSEGLATLLYPNQHASKFSTVGRPLFGNEVRIVELDGSGELSTPEQIGEICFRGPGMMIEYNNRDKQAAEEDWWQDPNTGQKFFRTGDVGKLDEDGFLSILERKKDMIISGGFNVYPKDIEDVLMQRNDIVSEVAVIPQPHEKWGETPVALVIPKHGVECDAFQLREWANQHLSKVQRISDLRVLSPTDSFPRNVLGKLVKKDIVW